MANLTPFQEKCNAEYGASYTRVDKRKMPELNPLTPDATAGTVIWYVDSLADMAMKPAILTADLPEGTKPTDQVNILALHTGSTTRCFVGQAYTSPGQCNKIAMPNFWNEEDLNALVELAKGNPNKKPEKKAQEEPVNVNEDVPTKGRGRGRGTKSEPKPEESFEPIAPATPEEVATLEESFGPSEPGPEQPVLIDEDFDTISVNDEAGNDPEVQREEDGFDVIQPEPEPEPDPSIDTDDKKVMAFLRLNGRANSFKLQDALGVKGDADGAKIVSEIMSRLVDAGLVDTEGERRGKTYGLTAAGIEKIGDVVLEESMSEAPAPKPKKEKKEKGEDKGAAAPKYQPHAWFVRQLQELVDQTHELEVSLKGILAQAKDGTMTDFPGSELLQIANAMGVVHPGILLLHFRGASMDGETINGRLDPSIELHRLEAQRAVREISHLLLAPEKPDAWKSIAKESKDLTDRAKSVVIHLKTPGMEKSVVHAEPIRDENGNRIDAGC